MLPWLGGVVIILVGLLLLVAWRRVETEPVELRAYRRMKQNWDSRNEDNL